jgi:hypothetical protein
MFFDRLVLDKEKGEDFMSCYSLDYAVSVAMAPWTSEHGVFAVPVHSLMWSAMETSLIVTQY